MATARFVAVEVRAIHEADVGSTAAERHHDDTAPFDVPQIVMREIHRGLPIPFSTEEQIVGSAAGAAYRLSFNEGRFAHVGVKICHPRSVGELFYPTCRLRSAFLECCQKTA